MLLKALNNGWENKGYTHTEKPQDILGFKSSILLFTIQFQILSIYEHIYPFADGALWQKISLLINNVI